MLKHAAALLLASFAALVQPVVAADDITVAIRDGRATVTARDATVADVLQAWSRAGGTTIVNADQLGNTKLTVQLVDVPEEQALDVILRSASGYVARRRAAPSPAGSGFDRVVILARSQAPPAPSSSPSPAPPPRFPPPGSSRPTFQPSPAPPTPEASAEPQTVERLIGPDGRPVPDDQDGVAPPPAAPLPVPRGIPFGDEPPSDPSMTPAGRMEAPAQGVPVPGMIVPAPPPVSAPAPVPAPPMRQPQR